jgi:transcriptional regulator with XRE-family HTH domain
MTRTSATSVSMQLGAKIANLRRKHRLTQKQVEASAGFHQGYISRIESGLIQPGFETLAAIAKVLGITLPKLVSGIQVVK